MADHFYGVAIGAGLDPAAVQTGTSTTSAVIELRLADGAGLTRIEVVKALTTLANHFKESVSVTA